MHDKILKGYKAGFSNGRSAKEIIDWVQGLPPMPEVATQALRKIDDPNCTTEDIAEVISHDASLTAQILRAGNSAATSRSKSVCSLNEAVQVAGLRYVKGIVMASVTRRWNTDSSPFARMVWERSIGTAVSTRILLAELGKRDQEKYFLAGLLHNLGQVVMLSHPEIGRTFPQVLKLIAEKKMTFSCAELEVVGFSHPLVGALVAEKWGFPEELWHTILHYDNPLSELPQEEVKSVATLKLSSLLTLSAGIGEVPGYPLNAADMHSLARQAGFPEDGLNEELDKVGILTKEQFVTEAALYS